MSVEQRSLAREVNPGSTNPPFRATAGSEREGPVGSPGPTKAVAAPDWRPCPAGVRMPRRIGTSGIEAVVRAGQRKHSAIRTDRAVIERGGVPRMFGEETGSRAPWSATGMADSFGGRRLASAPNL
jgi:hypothetical protein